MTLVSLISYIDRNTLALLAPTMLKQLHLTDAQYGWVVSGFSVAYMVSNLAWGRWIDRYGLRRSMMVAVGFWTVVSTCHAFVSGFWSLAIARTALGFGEGATFPGGLRTVTQTLPTKDRAKGVAVAYSGGSLGAVITPIIVTPVYLLFGWQGAFWFTGMVGALWLLLWRFVSRDPRLQTPVEPVQTPHPGPSDPRFWSFVFIYAFGALPLGFVLYYSGIYLSVLGKSQADLGRLLWIPPLGWEVGYFFWGWLTDRAVARQGLGVTAYRKLLLMLTVLSLPLAAIPSIASFPLLMIEFFFAMFIASGFVIAGVSYATTTFGAGHAGFLAGLGAGSWSALLALATPIVGWFFDRHEYSSAFLLATAFPVTGYLCWSVLNRKGELVSLP